MCISYLPVHSWMRSLERSVSPPGGLFFASIENEYLLFFLNLQLNLWSNGTQSAHATSSIFYFHCYDLKINCVWFVVCERFVCMRLKKMLVLTIFSVRSLAVCQPSKACYVMKRGFRALCSCVFLLPAPGDYNKNRRRVLRGIKKLSVS